MSDPLPGYTGKLREALESLEVVVGDRIRVVKNDEFVVEGVLMPREKLYAKEIIVIKLDNGYNIGVRYDSNTIIEKLGKKVKIKGIEKVKPVKNPKLPNVMIMSTGGTIASRVDYETGAVKPALTSEDLASLMPEIFEVANIDTNILFNIFSEDLTPKHWEKIAERAAKFVEEGFNGVVITHGTDTMAWTAAALSFAFRKLPVPIILVGAQRSSDRPSSDSAFNLLAAVVAAAKAPFAEVAIVMHGETGDSYALAHRGTKVRKMHTSRRDAFQSINDLPLAKIYPYAKRIEVINNVFRRRGEDKEVHVEAKFDEKVALIKFYSSIDPEVIDFFVDKKYHGIVLEGTGLGHFPQRLISAIKRAVEEGIAVVMTSQCLFGRINMYVYSTGRLYLEAGVIPGEDMLPEVAYVKLSWILAKTRDLNEVRKLMLTNIAGEINPRHTVNLYPRWPHES